MYPLGQPLLVLAHSGSQGTREGTCVCRWICIVTVALLPSSSLLVPCRALFSHTAMSFSALLHSPPFLPSISLPVSQPHSSFLSPGPIVSVSHDSVLSYRADRLTEQWFSIHVCSSHVVVLSLSQRYQVYVELKLILPSPSCVSVAR